MEVTNYLKNKLSKLQDNFTYKGETFIISLYDGTGEKSDIYWKGSNGTVIHMMYLMNKVGEDSYKGVRKILEVEMY